MPTLRYPFLFLRWVLNVHLTAWRCRCSCEPCILSVYTNVSLAATVREGGQIDVRPEPTFVSNLVRTGCVCDV